MAHPKLHRLQTAQGTFLPSTHSTTAPFPAIRCRCGTSTCKQFTTNGKYCSGYYLQDIDNQLYHNITRIFRPYLNIRKTLVIFPTTYKSRTYQNTPLLHLPLDPASPGLNHLSKVGNIRSCSNGSELRETILQHLHPGHSPTVAVHHRADYVGSRGQVGDERNALAYLQLAG